MSNQVDKHNFVEDFGSHVFGDEEMQRRLPKQTYQMLRKTIDDGLPLNNDVAQEVANAMKQWAMEKGATHYTHWFQPLTGITAEKHDSFISYGEDGGVIADFSGKALIRGESDASSFPSGGLRATFEARGYTAWDCTSPAFLKEDAAGVTLCIPTAFCSYTGVALDKKTPLLKSCSALSKQAMRILRLFGNDTAKRVIVTAGAEQEYFLVDKQLFAKREDLVFTGRTLFGTMPPKGQEMDDHYFGSLKERVAAYMKDLDFELWKLGVPAKTKHNEVAPSQHELAPIYTEVNIATDHNQLVMETMKRLAGHHGFACLLHEKPFSGINGSGKHDNWAIATDDGQNLLDPGKTPQQNAQFLLFLCAVIAAVDEHAALLRASAACAGNDHRLGASEAPPAIVSIFLGEQLTDILEHIVSGEENHAKYGGKLDIGVTTLPDLPKDSTDRNRTSPFAFTGNKFEFRMVPASASIAGPNTVLNTIVADSLCRFADRLEGAKDFRAELTKLIRDTVRQHRRIIFDGNGYSEEWVAEAERRGLPNITSSVDAYPAFISEKSIELFEKHGVYSRMELQSRYEIKMTKYIKVINIEARTMLEMAKRQILPAAMVFAGKIAASSANVRAAQPQLDTSAYDELLYAYTEAINSLQKNILRLEGILDNESGIEVENIHQKGEYCRDYLSKQMEVLRADADRLEAMTDRKMWPMPTYSELLYYI